MTIEKNAFGYSVIDQREVTVCFHQRFPFTRIVVRIYGSVSGYDYGTFDGEDALKHAIKFARARARIKSNLNFH